MGDAVADAVDGVRAAHPERRIDVTAEHGLEVLGDRDQLVRVVRNLATNAAVHTRPDGPMAPQSCGIRPIAHPSEIGAFHSQTMDAAQVTPNTAMSQRSAVRRRRCRNERQELRRACARRVGRTPASRAL